MVSLDLFLFHEFGLTSLTNVQFRRFNTAQLIRQPVSRNLRLTLQMDRCGQTVDKKPKTD